MSRSDWREAIGYCAETCPAVDKAFDALVSELEPIVGEDGAAMVRLVEACCQTVKDKGTLLLRDALVSACADKLRSEEERDELERERDDLKTQVESLKDEIRALERELSECAA